ncbi:hypothetical protein [Halomarina oriensis]|uniref:DUF1918 domain-containing protein n=1 Tax=Halomarina oriensis TaxID=671145 RepID=A0A6B0GHL6_9EURY|nr:hypothetical protein [Halomarina oriensis]MWG33281.1 hypothetical protein [Halomarina oriensis]
MAPDQRFRIGQRVTFERPNHPRHGAVCSVVDVLAVSHPLADYRTYVVEFVDTGERVRASGEELTARQ